MATGPYEAFGKDVRSTMADIFGFLPMAQAKFPPASFFRDEITAHFLSGSTIWYLHMEINSSEFSLLTIFLSLL